MSEDDADELLERAADEIERLRAALEQVAAQHSGVVGSTARADCMAAMARLALRSDVE